MEESLRADRKKRHQTEVFDSEIGRLSARYAIALPEPDKVEKALVRHPEKGKSKWASADLRNGT